MLKKNQKKPNLCTRCGTGVCVMKPMSVWWHAVQVKIQLCQKCVKASITNQLDLQVEGTSRDMIIDRLSHYHQL